MKYIILILVLFPLLCPAQDRYMVFFMDKNSSPHSIQAPESFLSQRSIDRRQKEGILIVEQDLPVVQSYVDQVESAGAEVFFTTKWLNGVLIQADGNAISQIELLNFVASTEFVAPGMQLAGGRVQKRQDKLDLEESTDVQNEFIGSTEMISMGYDGTGIRIAVVDAGFPGVDQIQAFDGLNINQQIVDTRDFITNSQSVYQYHQHGAMVLSTMAGFLQGEFVGNARGAEYLLYVSEDVSTEYRIEEYNMLFALERADSAGADIVTTSLGYVDFDDPNQNYSALDMDGTTTIAATAYNIAAEKGMLMVTSAGNSGPGPSTLTTPADCITCFSVGAINSTGTIGTISSRGPTADGRTKPDLVAMGIGTKVVNKDNNVVSVNGTSVAAPQLAGLAAGIWQKYPYMKVSDLIFYLKETASNASNPDNSIGWGIPNFVSVVNYIETISQEESIALFPTLVDSPELFVQVNDPNKFSEATYSIINAKGQKQLEGALSFNWLDYKKTIQIPDLSQGLYLVRIISGDEIVEKRILVKR